jgi:hypothetical protein
MPVESTRSQNITVTCRRSPAVSAIGAAIGAADAGASAGAAAGGVLRELGRLLWQAALTVSQLAAGSQRSPQSPVREIISVTYDTWRLRRSSMIRLAPQQFPLLDFSPNWRDYRATDVLRREDRCSPALAYAAYLNSISLYSIGITFDRRSLTFVNAASDSPQ